MKTSPTMVSSIPTFITALLLLSSLSHSLTDSEASAIARRQLESFSTPKFVVEFAADFPSPSLRNAFSAFDALKKSIHSDPSNFTGNWVGPNVCSYNGIFCSPSPGDPNLDVVSAVDLNGADIAGFLPTEIALLADAAVFHANSNRFCGVIPASFAGLRRLVELDVSNNRLAGGFPAAVLEMPALRYLDLRFNRFEGPLPPGLFDKKLDAIFLNDNRFNSTLPENVGNSAASVAVLANNNLTGRIPASIGGMANLDEFVIRNNELDGCLPAEAGLLSNLTVFDVSHNALKGEVPKGVCELRSLSSFNFSHNYFNQASEECFPSAGKSQRVSDGTSNCLPRRPKQKDPKACLRFGSRALEI